LGYKTAIELLYEDFLLPSRLESLDIKTIPHALVREDGKPILSILIKDQS